MNKSKVEEFHVPFINNLVIIGMITIICMISTHFFIHYTFQSPSEHPQYTSDRSQNELEWTFLELIASSFTLKQSFFTYYLIPWWKLGCYRLELYPIWLKLSTPVGRYLTILKPCGMLCILMGVKSVILGWKWCINRFNWLIRNWKFCTKFWGGIWPKKDTKTIQIIQMLTLF